MIDNLVIAISFLFAVYITFIADPARPNKWDIELQRRKREIQASKTDGFTPLNLPPSILRNLSESRHE